MKNAGKLRNKALEDRPVVTWYDQNTMISSTHFIAIQLVAIQLKYFSSLTAVFCYKQGGFGTK